MIRAFLILVVSAIAPGSGHALLGRERTALLLISPFAVILGVVLGAIVSLKPELLAAWAISAGGLTVIAAVNLIIAGLRAVSLIDLVRSLQSTSLRVVGLSLLVATVIAPHLFIAHSVNTVAASIDQVFSPPLEEGEPAPTGPIELPWVVPAAASPAGDDGRLDILLLGSDAGPGRWGRRTDVMILASIDVQTGVASLASLPRNWRNIPLPPAIAAKYPNYRNGIYTGMLNELYTRGSNDGTKWPGETSFLRGVGAVRSTIETLIERPIDGVLLIDIGGFIRIIDAIGGITIDVERRIDDPDYSDGQGGFGKRLIIEKGRQHMDGALAIAYVRSRHDSSDYDRMARQQRFLTALFRALGPSAILNAPSIAVAAGGMVWTDIPRDSLPAIAAIAGTAAATDQIRTLRFVPPKYPQIMDAADVARVRAAIAGSLAPR